MGYEVLHDYADIHQTGVEVDGMVPYRYDPLHDDSQAMALVKRFRLDINDVVIGTERGWGLSYFADDFGEIPGDLEDNIDDNRRPDRHTTSTHMDLNRAIVECVALIKEPKA